MCARSHGSGGAMWELMHSASAPTRDACSESGYACGPGLGKKGSPMKKTILAAALVVALPLMQPASAQAPEQKAAAAQPAEPAKPADAAKPAPKAKLARAPHKMTAKRHQDARHCLERPD